MSALQWIVKEAKAIKKKYPKRFSKWTDYVAQASAIYASKHKGKSPVGKKKIAKKKSVKRKVAKKRIGATAYEGIGKIVRKKAVRKTATKRIKRKPSEKTVLKSIKHAVNVQKAHMSGVGSLNKHALKQYDELLNKINKVERHIAEYTMMSKNMAYNLDNRKSFKLSASKWKKYLSELKTHAKELKKHL